MFLLWQFFLFYAHSSLLCCQASAAKFGEALKNCVLYLSKEVVDPLEEFEFGIKFATETLREELSNQRAVLHGPPEQDVSNSGSSSSLALVDKKDDAGGLLQKFEDAERKHALMKTKLDALGDKIQLQKTAAAGSLHVSKQMHIGLTRAEELYKVQVDRWHTGAQHLAVSLDRLAEQVESLRTHPVDSGTPTEPAGGRVTARSRTTPRKKPPFLSPTKPRSGMAHISSPHRISYRSSPSAGDTVPGRLTPKSHKSPAPRRNIQLDVDEKESCVQLQLETGKMHEALKKQIKDVEDRMSRLTTAI